MSQFAFFFYLKACACHSLNGTKKNALLMAFQHLTGKNNPKKNPENIMIAAKLFM
jgi:hypothetical protein